MDSNKKTRQHCLKPHKKIISKKTKSAASGSNNNNNNPNNEMMSPNQRPLALQYHPPEWLDQTFKKLDMIVATTHALVEQTKTDMLNYLAEIANNNNCSFNDSSDSSDNDEFENDP